MACESVRWKLRLPIEEAHVVKPVPEGYHSVTPYLIVLNCAKAVSQARKILRATPAKRLCRSQIASALPGPARRKAL